MRKATHPLSRSSAVVLGTAGFGTDIPALAAFALMDAYVERGGNHLDTAHDYASWVPSGIGASEKTIGQWLKRSGARENLLVATKGGCTKDGQKRVRRDVVRDELRTSLARLEIDSVDLYWLHRDDPAVPVGEIIDWMEELKSEGRLIAYGASNWSAERLEAAGKYAAKRGVAGFAGSQCGWNLPALSANPFDAGDARFVTSEDERWHAETKMPLVAWEAQAGGFFSGQYGPGKKASSPRGHVVDLHYGNAANWKRIEVAAELARNYSATPNQVILAWLRYQSFPVFAVIGPRTMEQLTDSLASTKLSLTPQDVERLCAPLRDAIAYKMKL
ncbi:MAG TPA: aldo/keto reductase [Opitutaceae bacterium]|nr:aldo/keto reductase [Opitutaceae bacterium]